MTQGMDPLATNHPQPSHRGINPPAAPAAPRTEPLDRRQILDATARCLAEVGYDGTTIRRIAGSLQCAVGSIYRYFADKRQLLEAVTQRRFEGVAAASERGMPLEVTVNAYAARAADDPQSYRLMFWLASLHPRQADAAALPQVIRRIIAAWGRHLGDEARAHRLWSLVHGAVMLGKSADDALQDAEPLLVRKLGTVFDVNVRRPAPVTSSPGVTSRADSGSPAAQRADGPMRYAVR